MDNNTVLQQENNELKSRLRAFAAILRLNRDAFSFKDLRSTALHIVNDSKTLLTYDRSSLVDLRSRRVIAEYSQTEVNEHTRYARALTRLCRELKFGNDPLEVTADCPEEILNTLSGKGKESLHHLTEDGTHLLMIPLRHSKNPESERILSSGYWNIKMRSRGMFLPWWHCWRQIIPARSGFMHRKDSCGFGAVSFSGSPLHGCSCCCWRHLVWRCSR